MGFNFFNFELAGAGALHPGPLPQCGRGGGISDAKGEDLPGEGEKTWVFGGDFAGKTRDFFMV